MGELGGFTFMIFSSSDNNILNNINILYYSYSTVNYKEFAKMMSS